MTTRTVTSAVASPAGPRERFGWAPLLVLLTGTFMTFLEFFIVNVGMPSIQRDLHGAPRPFSWMASRFGLDLCVGLISGGPARRPVRAPPQLHRGPGPVHGPSPSACWPRRAGFLIAAIPTRRRAELMTPQVLAILGTVYTGERRTREFAAYGMTMGLADVLGSADRRRLSRSTSLTQARGASS